MWCPYAIIDLCTIDTPYTCASIGIDTLYTLYTGVCVAIYMSYTRVDAYTIEVDADSIVDTPILYIDTVVATYIDADSIVDNINMPPAALEQTGIF